MPYGSTTGAGFQLFKKSTDGQNAIFADAAARDTYFAANPDDLALLDANEFLIIKLLDNGSGEVAYQQRSEGAWVDVTSLVQGETGPAGATGNSYFFASIAARDTFFNTDTNSTLLEDGLPISVNVGEVGEDVTSDFVWRGADNPMTYDSSLWRLAGSEVSSGTLYFAPQGASINSGNEVLGFTTAEGVTHYLHGIEYTDSGTSQPDFWVLDGKINLPVADVSGTTLADPQGFTIQTTIDSLISEYKLIPASTGDLRIQVFVGTDDTGPVIVDAYETVLAPSIGVETTFSAPNNTLLEENTDVFIRFSGIQLEGGLQTLPLVSGEITPWLSFGLQVGNEREYITIDPTTSEVNEIPSFINTEANLLQTGTKIKAVPGTNALLVLGTDFANTSIDSSIEFQDSIGGYLANIGYDGSDAELNISSDEAVNISASGDAYLTANNVLEIQSNSGTIEISAATTMDITSQLALNVGTSGADLTLSAQNTLVQAILATGYPLAIENTTDGTPRVEFYSDSSNPEGVRTASPGAISVVADTTTPANNGIYQLHSNVAANTPWELIGGAGSGGDVSRSGSTRDGAVATWSGVDTSTIVDEGLAAISGDVMTFTPGTATNTYGIVMGSAVDGEIFMNGATKQFTTRSVNGSVFIESNTDEVQLSAISGLSALTLGANSTLDSNLQLDISSGSDTNVTAAGKITLDSSDTTSLDSTGILSINSDVSVAISGGSTAGITSPTGVVLEASVLNAQSATFTNFLLSGGSVDAHVIDYDPEATLSARNGALAYRIDTSDGSNIKEYRLKANGAGTFNTPWVEVGGAGNGDITGPVSSVDTELAIFNGTSGDVIQGGTNITAEVGQNNAELRINTTNDANTPQIFFSGVAPSSGDEGWIYLDPAASVFGVRGANGAQYSAGTKLELSCDAGDIDIVTLSADINIDSQQDVNIEAITGAAIVKADSGQVTLSSGVGMTLTKTGGSLSDPVAVFKSNGSNGGDSNYNVTNASPRGVRNGVNSDIVHSASTTFNAANVYVYNGNDNQTGWVGCAGGPEMLCFGNLNVQSGTTTRYLDYGNNQQNQAGSDIDYAKTRVSRDGIAQRLTICHGDPDGNGNDINYTLMVNGVATALSVNVSSIGNTATTTTARVNIARQDEVTIRVTKASSIGSSPKNVTANVDFL